MDGATLERVCSLAPALRQSAHLLLHQHHSLSLDTWTLGEIQEAFSLILEVEQHTNFHVLPPNHRQHPAIPHLQLIYDLLQKVSGLRLWARDGPAVPPGRVTSLRCFRALRSLEVSHVPVGQLKALQTLRPSLRRLVVSRSITRPADLFLRCGADKAGEFVWEQLQEAILSHNTLLSLDDSLQLLPNLKVLDVSHCGLEDVSALEHLPSLTFLDVSHNQLPHLPRLAPRASHSLLVLKASNNLLTHLSGLQVMTGLEEVDLRENLLAGMGGLVPLAALPHLRSLRLAGNPVCCGPNHRRHTLSLLHPATAHTQVVFDGELLSSHEQQVVGSISSPPELFHSVFSSPISPLLPQTPLSPTCPLESPEAQQPDSSDSQPPSLAQDSVNGAAGRVAGNGQPRRRSKKKRTRHIALTDPEVGEGGEAAPPDTHLASLSHPEGVIDAVPDPPPPSLVESGSFPFTATSDTVTQALVSLTHAATISTPAQEQSDQLLEEILQAKVHSGTPVTPTTVGPPTPALHPKDHPVSAHRPSTPSATHEEDPIEQPSCTATVTGETSAAPGPSMESSLESSFYKAGPDFSTPTSSSVSPPVSEGEEEEEGDVQLVLAQREGGGGVMEELSDVILAVTASHFKEKHGITARTLFKWDLRCVESLEILSTSPRHRLLVTFDTTRPAYRTRTYVLDPDDYQSLMAVLTPIVERNTLREVLHSAMNCLKCSTQFSRDLALHPQGSDTLKCPNCGGGVVVHAGSVDHPAVTATPPLLPPCTGTPLTSTPRGPSNSIPPQESGAHLGESGDSVSVCSEESASWGVRRESDVEVISNPSVSSIEVLPLAEPLVPAAAEGLVGGQEDEDEGNPGWLPAPFPAQVHTDGRTPAPSPQAPRQDPPSSTMQESSSSGSMTGSVCTAYERGGGSSFPPTPHKAPQPPLADEVDSSLAAPSTTTTTTSTSCDVSSTLYITAETTLGALARAASPSPGTSPHSSSHSSEETIKNGVPKGSVQREEEEEEGGKGSAVSISSWVQSLLHTLTGYYWRWWEEVEEVEGLQKTPNPISYSYEDFSEVDHRLKLYCEVLLLQDPEEHLLGLLKAVVLLEGGRREFQGLLVLSSKQLYVLEITGPEDDSPQSWLEEVLREGLAGVQEVHSLYQRQGLALTLSSTLLLLSLADPLRANSFFNFLIEVLDDHGVTPTIVESSPAQEAALTTQLQESVGDGEEAAPPTLLAMVSLLLEGGCSESQFLVMSDTDLVLYQATLEWYLPPAPPPSAPLKLTRAQKVSNITAIEVHSESHLALLFLDEVSGEEAWWGLHVASPLSACRIIEAVRTPWTQLFSVDLQVTYHTTPAAPVHTLSLPPPAR